MHCFQGDLTQECLCVITGHAFLHTSQAQAALYNSAAQANSTRYVIARTKHCVVTLGLTLQATKNTKRHRHQRQSLSDNAVRPSPHMLGI